MRPRILVLGAGFGGLELSTLLSESLGDTVEVTLIDKSDHFIFGFSKLDVMFGHAEAHAVRLPFKNFTKPGVRMLQQTITSIDPAKRRITTDKGQFEADYLVVAFGRRVRFCCHNGTRRRHRILFGGGRREDTRRSAQIHEGTSVDRCVRRSL
jgi:sulfide:quinone oxidoreductase